MQKLQNRAARVLTYSSYDASADNLIKILDWKDIACQQQNARATMVYKCLHGLAPEYLCSKFSKRDSVYSLRDSENKVPLPRTNYLKNSFSYSNAITWNNLPCEARLAESLSAFQEFVISNVRQGIHGKQLFFNGGGGGLWVIIIIILF